MTGNHLTVPIHDVVFNHLSELGSIQFVDQPTRLNNTATGNILDLIFSNDPMPINIETYGSPIGSSDHCIINFNVFTNPADRDSKATVNNVDRLNYWSNADFTGINNYLCGIDWNCVFGYNFDADSIWNGFKCTIWPIIEIFVPKKTVHHYHKYRPRQYPKHIRKLLIKKSKSPQSGTNSKITNHQTYYSIIAQFLIYVNSKYSNLIPNEKKNFSKLIILAHFINSLIKNYLVGLV